MTYKQELLFSVFTETCRKLKAQGKPAALVIKKTRAVLESERERIDNNNVDSVVIKLMDLNKF